MEPSTTHMDRPHSHSGRKRRASPALACALIVSAVSFLSQSGTVAAADVNAQAADVSHPIFSVIVTRHGVRSPTKFPGGEYTWPKWDPVPDAFLTKHGYQLMTLMGVFYAKAVYPKGAVDCAKVFVYADKVQRTYLSAQALLEGLCGKAAIPIYHEPDVKAADPIFNGAGWVGQRIDSSASKDAVAAVAGSPLSTIVMGHAQDFSTFQQGILDSRCPLGSCTPIATAASKIPKTEGLAELDGPLDTASTYSEDVFLEYAQCRPIAEIAPKRGEDKFEANLQAGMQLHALAYRVNARNAYNPLVRGGTLLAHIVGMLDLKAGLPEVLRVDTPTEVKDVDLVIPSGHDTQLGALGGILDAHWAPVGGIVPDDMPPGSALVIDLVKTGTGYGVQLRFASMTLDQFRNKKDLKEGDPIRLTSVTGSSLCNSDPCVVPLEQFEGLALTLQAQQLVDPDWHFSNAGLQFAPLQDPDWTDADCKQ
jgi:hypothetical protein